MLHCCPQARVGSEVRYRDTSPPKGASTPKNQKGFARDDLLLRSRTPPGNPTLSGRHSNWGWERRPGTL